MFSTPTVSGALTVLLLLTLLFLFIVIRERNRYRRGLRQHASAISLLQKSFAATERRFQHLFDSATDSVYCYELDPPVAIDQPTVEIISQCQDAVLTRCNNGFASAIGAGDVNAIIGSRFGDLDSSKCEDSHADFMTTFIDNGFDVAGYELEFENRNGEPGAVIVNMVGELQDGHLKSLWAVESNIVDLRTARQELHRRNRFQTLVASISSQLINASEENCDNVVNDCLRQTCEFIAAGRTVLFWANDDGKTIQASNIWSEAIAKSPTNISVKSIPCISRHILSNKVVRVDDILSLPAEFARDRMFLQDYDVKSFLVLPLTDAGKVVGGLTFARLDKGHPWSDQDVQDLSVLSELFANFVLRLNSRRALGTALANLQQASERLEAENVYLKDEIKLHNRFDTIVGESNSIRRCLQLVEQVAETTTPVLILGETGTGKELIAHAIHNLSSRRDRALVKVNCAALPASLIESELFGHEKGAFTGADSAKRGRFDLASGSTLFLDEFGEIPFELQAKLLRVLQEGEFERLGGSKTVSVDVRIIVATNRDLSAAVAAKEFRSDLYYRVSTFPIELPPLRARGTDVDLLVRHFVDLHAPRLNREVTELSAEMMRQVRGYHWPGNVRELEGIVQRALIASDKDTLELAEPLAIRKSSDAEPRIVSSTIDGLKLVERDEIVSVLDRTRWRISGEFGAAKLLGIPPSTLRSKMKRLGISKPN